MAKKGFEANSNAEHGFSLIELMLSLLILTIVIGVVTQGITTMQAKNTVETNKVDLTQETREFMDQITNDLHQSGFPLPGMFDPSALALQETGPLQGAVQNPPAGPGSPAICTYYRNVACGIMFVSATQVQFEGDVDGTGVSEEWIQLVQSNGNNPAPCNAPPCVIQRGTVAKSTCTLGATVVCNPPPFYTEVNNVMNTNIFTAYDNNGKDLSPLFPINSAVQQGSGIANGLNIRAIGITLWVQSQQRDAQTKVFPTVTMVSTARIND